MEPVPTHIWTDATGAEWSSLIRQIMPLSQNNSNELGIGFSSAAIAEAVTSAGFSFRPHSGRRDQRGQQSQRRARLNKDLAHVLTRSNISGNATLAFPPRKEM